MVENVQYGELMDPLIPVENGSHETVLGLAVTTRGNSRVLAKRVPHHELVREVLCNLLAQAVDLPVPMPYVLDIREVEWPMAKSPLRNATPRTPVRSDYVFGTLFRQGRNLVRVARQAPGTIDEIVKWAKFLPAIAFDEWIANEDRNASNLLYSGRREFELIDHGEALPNGMGRNTKLANRLARHLVASQSTAHRRDLSQRVLESCSEFGRVNFHQVEVAANARAWGGQPVLEECIRLLEDRLTHLPILIEEEFRVDQGQLLA